MIKKYWIYLVIGILIFGGSAAYFYFNMSIGQSTSVEVQSQSPSKSGEDGLDNKAGQDRQSNNKENPEKENPENVKSVEGADSSAREIYIYRNSFRNPFSGNKNMLRPDQEPAKDSIENKTVVTAGSKRDKSQKEDKNKVEMIKSELPFHITGIIGNVNRRIAIINSNKGSRIVKGGEKINDFIIEKILEDGLLISYNGFVFKMKIGGSSGDR